MAKKWKNHYIYIAFFVVAFDKKLNKILPKMSAGIEMVMKI